jgi:hypothetical protein
MITVEPGDGDLQSIWIRSGNAQGSRTVGERFDRKLPAVFQCIAHVGNRTSDRGSVAVMATVVRESAGASRQKAANHASGGEWVVSTRFMSHS